MFNDRSVRSRFVKETKLPIPVLDSPYFEYFVDLYEVDMGSRTRFKEFVKVNENVVDYMDRYNKFKDDVIHYVKSCESFKEFSNTVLDAKPLTSINLFTEDNCGRWISIDLRSANFSVLRRFDEALVRGFDNYEEFAESFDNGEMFSHSKATRQVIFGNLNPKRLQNHQKYCMGLVSDYVIRNFREVEMYSLGSDEVVLRYDESLYEFLVSDAVRVEMAELTGLGIVVDRFVLEKNGEFSEFGFVKKDFEDSGFELVAVPKTFYAQAYKYYKGEELIDFDLVSHHEGFVVKFVETVEDKYRRKSR